MFVCVCSVIIVSVFTARAAISCRNSVRPYWLSVCLSAHLSVTRVLCVKIKQCTTDILMPHVYCNRCISDDDDAFVFCTLIVSQFGRWRVPLTEADLSSTSVRRTRLLSVHSAHLLATIRDIRSRPARRRSGLYTVSVLKKEPFLSLQQIKAASWVLYNIVILTYLLTDVITVCPGLRI